MRIRRIQDNVGEIPAVIQSRREKSTGRRDAVRAPDRNILHRELQDVRRQHGVQLVASFTRQTKDKRSIGILQRRTGHLRRKHENDHGPACVMAGSYSGYFLNGLAVRKARRSRLVTGDPVKRKRVPMIGRAAFIRS